MHGIRTVFTQDSLGITANAYTTNPVQLKDAFRQQLEATVPMNVIFEISLVPNIVSMHPIKRYENLKKVDRFVNIGKCVQCKFIITIGSIYIENISH